MTQFVVPKSESVSSLIFSKIISIDISSFTNPADYISLSLPEFPGGDLDVTQTFIDLTSNPTGDFAVGPTNSIAFDQGFSGSSLFPEENLWPEVNLYPLAGEGVHDVFPEPELFLEEDLYPEGETGPTGDVELRFPISLLTTIDKSSITGVRFRIFAFKKCTFRCLSIRACSTAWTYAPIDLDTLWDRIHRPPSTNGSANQSSEFPTSITSPKEWPITFRSDDLSGLKDPMPIDMGVGVDFSAGSFINATGKTESDFNELALYFRDIPTADQTQLDLNSKSQGGLDVLGDQPDFGTALYIDRDQKLLDTQVQGELEGDTQFNIERLPDYNTHTWLEVKLKWGAEKSQLTIFNSEEIGYTFSSIAIEASDPAELNDGQYILLVNLKDSSIRVKIYKLDQVGNIIPSELVFDSGLIVDDDLIKRRKGRFGWWANLLDGDAFLRNIKTRGVNFGEVISKEFQSITPVKGVSLYAGSTANSELVTELYPTNQNSIKITPDPSASAGGHAYKIITSPLVSLQGVGTNYFLIDDPSNLDMSFDVKFPSASPSSGELVAFLLGEYEQIIPLNISAYAKNIWSHVKIDLKNYLFQTGAYKLVIMQTLPVVITTWWIENLSVTTSSVKWSARSHAPDPWDLEEEQWLSLESTLNTENGGVVFDEIGSGLQIRGQSSKQDSEIHEYKAIPQYATLGRFVWEDEIESDPYAPSAKIESEVNENSVSLEGIASDPEEDVVLYLWSFGDGGNDSGLQVSHTYETEGTYIVILTVKDSFGNSDSTSKEITIS